MSDIKQVDGRFEVRVRNSAFASEQAVETYTVEQEATQPEPAWEDHAGRPLNLELAKTDSSYYQKNRESVIAARRHAKSKAEREAQASDMAQRKAEVLATMKRRREESDKRREEEARLEYERSEAARKRLWKL